MFVDHLRQIWADIDQPFLQVPNGKISGLKKSTMYL